MEHYDKPLPDADLDTQPFWDFCRSHEVRAQQCPSCSGFRWPPQAICPYCHAWNDEWTLLKPAGVLYSFSIVHHVTVPAFKPDVPFVVSRATVDDTGGRVIIPGILVGCPLDAVRVGMALEIFFEDVTETFSLPRFRPLAKELVR